MIATDVRTQIGQAELANHIEHLVKHELMMRYDLPLGEGVELDLTRDGSILVVEPNIGVMVVDEDLPPRYATLVAAAIYLRDMDGAA